MKIRIDGRELLVKKRVRDIVELQRQTGWKMEDIDKQVAVSDALAIPMTAFFALANAGFNPVFEDLLDRDPEDFELVEEAGDTREGGDVTDPPQPRSDSDPGGDEHKAEAEV